MIHSRHRRFTLADILILVAAAAIASGLNHAYHRSGPPPTNPWPHPYPWQVCTEAAPWVIAAALALLICRVLPPTPGLRRALRQPGTISVATIVIGTIPEEIAWLMIDLPQNSSWVSGLRAIIFSGGHVMVVWSLMILQRRWRWPSDWIEWAGTLLGMLIIGLWLYARIGWF